MYEGGGVIWFLACYGYYYKNLTAVEYSKKLFNSAYTLYTKGEKDEFFLSALTGNTSLIYLAYNLSQIFPMEPLYSNSYNQLIEDCSNYLRSTNFSNLTNETMVITDYLYGIPSALHFFSNLYRHSKDTNIQFIVNKLYVKLETVLNNGLDKEEIGVAHGLSGIVIGLMSVYSVDKKDTIIPLVNNLLKKEYQLNKETDDIKYSWCRGLVGLLLARHIVVKNLPTTSDLRLELVEEIKDLLKPENLKNYFSLRSMCLCHGIYGNLDILSTILRESDYLSSEIKSNIDAYCRKEYVSAFENIDINTTNKFKLDGFLLGISGVLYTIMSEFQDCPSVLNMQIIKPNL